MKALDLSGAGRAFRMVTLGGASLRYAHNAFVLGQLGVRGRGVRQVSGVFGTLTVGLGVNAVEPDNLRNGSFLSVTGDLALGAVIPFYSTFTSGVHAFQMCSQWLE